MRSNLGFIGLGVVVGLTTIYLVPARHEISVWLALIVVLVSAVSLLTTHGVWKRAFRASMLSGASVTATHASLLDPYLKSHPGEAAWLAEASSPLPERIVLLLIGPVYWLILFVVVGGVASAWRSVRRRWQVGRS
jgi:uncharacterized membrane protein (Fun14 family)